MPSHFTNRVGLMHFQVAIELYYAIWRREGLIKLKCVGDIVLFKMDSLSSKEIIQTQCNSFWMFNSSYGSQQKNAFPKQSFPLYGKNSLALFKLERQAKSILFVHPAPSLNSKIQGWAWLHGAIRHQGKESIYYRPSRVRTLNPELEKRTLYPLSHQTWDK